ncbi:hypothetical protein L218DRAFT_1081132 [Marasmius fiardii PR-910]|nr:hypothetical protein L218DRAFT_1081132 [Marasmius fiardii PR-910]
MSAHSYDATLQMLSTMFGTALQMVGGRSDGGGYESRHFNFDQPQGSGGRISREHTGYLRGGCGHGRSSFGNIGNCSHTQLPSLINCMSTLDVGPLKKKKKNCRASRGGKKVVDSEVEKDKGEGEGENEKIMQVDDENWTPYERENGDDDENDGEGQAAGFVENDSVAPAYYG